MIEKINVAVLMGGDTSEYEISLKSADFVWKTLCDLRCNAYKVHIKNNRWEVLFDGKKYPIDKNDFSATLAKNTLRFDYVFNLIHGSPGEDGKLAAYFDLIHLPSNTATHYPLALTYNKKDTLSVVKKMGIATADSFYLNKGDTICYETIGEKVGFPCFVKPNCGGSSLGMSKIYTLENLPAALEKAFAEDDAILIESFLEGTEVSVGVLNYRGKNQVLPITAIIPENDFFDYEAKYLGKSKEITPANVSPAQEKNVRRAALAIYEQLKMNGFSRSEFIFRGDTPYFLEMNTIPGMTAESILPQQISAAGFDIKDIFSDMILSGIATVKK